MTSDALDLVKAILQFLVVPLLLQNQKQLNMLADLKVKNAVLEERMRGFQTTVDALLNRRRRGDTPPAAAPAEHD